MTYNTTNIRDERKAQLQREIEMLDRRLRYLRKEINEIMEQEREEAARALILKLGLSRDMIHDPDEKDIPWFGHISNWVEYIRELPVRKLRPYAAWNGLIYQTDHLLSGGFKHLQDVYMSDVRK